MLQSSNLSPRQKSYDANFLFSTMQEKNVDHDWNLIGLRFQNSHKNIIEYPLINILNNQNKIWLTWVSTNHQISNGILIIIDNVQGYCSIYNKSGLFIGNLELNETFNSNNPITLIDILSAQKK